MGELERIAYADGETSLTGWLARPAGAPRAAVAVYPTFMNTTPGVEAKARALATQGYLAFIADFYGPDSPHDFDSANAAMIKLRADPAAMRRRLRATLTKLDELAPGLPQAAIGFCLGGGFTRQGRGGTGQAHKCFCQVIPAVGVKYRAV